MRDIRSSSQWILEEATTIEVGDIRGRRSRAAAETTEMGDPRRRRETAKELAEGDGGGTWKRVTVVDEDSGRGRRETARL